MIKLIIFDFDDTLVDSKEAHYELDGRVAKELGLKPVLKETYFKHYGIPYNKMIKEYYPSCSVEKFREISDRMYHSIHFHLFPGVIQTLDYLKRKYRLAILSSKENGFLRPVLKKLDIDDYFDHIHGKEDSEHHKPDGRVFDKILHHFKLKKDEVAYIGDLESDRDAALSAGIFFVGINDCPKEGILWCDSIEGLKKIF